MHAIRGPAADQQLGLCMIAMRTLSTMYWAGNLIRTVFQKFGEWRRKTAQAALENVHGSNESASESMGCEAMNINGGILFDCPRVDGPERYVIDPDLAECWQELISAESLLRPLLMLEG